MEVARDSSTPAQVCDPQGPTQALLRPDALLCDHRATLTRLRDLAGVPEAHWEALYLEALRRYAGFVQRLPTQAAGKESDDRRLLNAGLDTAVAALTVRQGRLLPPAADAETLIRTQDVWTYALFSAALLVTLDALGELDVERLGRGGTALGRWQPSAGPMSVPAVAYRVSARANGTKVSVPLPMLVPHLLPSRGIEWLSSESRVFRDWYDALSGEREKSTGIGALLEATRSRTETGRSGQPATTETPSTRRFAFVRPSAESVSRRAIAPADDPTPNPGRDFLEWLREGLRTRSLSGNEPGGLVHVTAEGLLLVSPEIFRAFDSTNWARVQRRFARLRLHARSADAGNIHTYVLPGRRAHAVRGYLIPEPARALGDIPLPPPNPQLTRKSADVGEAQHSL